jgi:hypothetical protein
VLEPPCADDCECLFELDGADLSAPTRQEDEPPRSVADQDTNPVTPECHEVGVSPRRSPRSAGTRPKLAASYHRLLIETFGLRQAADYSAAPDTVSEEDAGHTIREGKAFLAVARDRLDR